MRWRSQVRDYEHALDECLAADGYLTARPDVHGDGCFCTFTETPDDHLDPELTRISKAIMDAYDREPSEDALLEHRHGETR